MPGAFTSGTNHFAHAGKPANPDIAAAYMDGPLTGVDKAARAIVRVVETPLGTRLFRVHVDPSRYGAEEVNAVADRVRAEKYHRIELGWLLRPAGTGDLAD